MLSLSPFFSLGDPGRHCSVGIDGKEDRFGEV